MLRKSLFRRALVAAAVGAVLAIGAPLAASAHVTVNPNTADPGAYSTLVFRVPNESETARTIRVEVSLPADTPFTSVLYQAVPGWTATIVEGALPAPVTVGGNAITQAARSIVWQADPGGGLGTGQFVNLTVVLGPVPDTGHVLLPAVQTYDDGSISNWTATPDEVAADDTLDPAPVLYITDTPPAGHHGAATTATHTTTDAAATAPASSDSGVALGLSIAALVVAAGAAVLGALAFARRRKA
ncbi:YcnI family copper-binding membrane protein [Microbacterium sp. CJ88]|uniref:YcnI family copper-binding membrane protein n=1 Tax=Microbacterium sp. CJ88 TaxID=3445672 RepID=UPI003F654ABA